MDRILKRSGKLNMENCKQVSHFVAFMFEAIKV